MVGTIHGFQGDQCDIIITVFNPPTGIKVAADRIMLNNRNVLNVAISRASDYLFVLLPHPDSYGYENLIEINKLCGIANRKCSSVCVVNSEIIEQAIFDKKYFIEQNTFVTTHQVANVYTSVSGLYEVRIDENAVDIQTAGDNYQPKNTVPTNDANQINITNPQTTFPHSPFPTKQETFQPLVASNETLDTQSFTSEEQYYKYFKEYNLTVDSALKLLFEDNTICAFFTVLQIFGDPNKTHFFGISNMSESDARKWRERANSTELGKYIFPQLFYAVRGQRIQIKGLHKHITDINLKDFSEAISAVLERRNNKNKNKTKSKPEKKKRHLIGEYMSLPYTYTPYPPRPASSHPSSSHPSSSEGHAYDDFEYGLSDW